MVVKKNGAHIALQRHADALELLAPPQAVDTPIRNAKDECSSTASSRFSVKFEDDVLHTELLTYLRT